MRRLLGIQEKAVPRISKKKILLKETIFIPAKFKSAQFAQFAKLE